MTLDDYLLLLSRTSHKCLFHFTDKRNLASIRQHGLLSMRKMRELGIKPSATGGNDWSLEADAHSGMDGYIHLCLLSEHPMEWLAKQKKQIEESTFLRVRPEIMRLEGVMMTAEVANKSGVAPCSPNELLGSLDLEVIYGRTDWKLPEIRERRKAAKLYEILIPEHVPAAMILNLDG